MPGFLTNQYCNLFLDTVFGGLRLEPPDYLYLGLSRVPANRAGLIVEPDHDGGYVRVAVTNSLEEFSVAQDGSKANLRTISFPHPQDSWGLILAVFVANTAHGGSVLAIADLPKPRSIRAGDPNPQILPGALIISLQ